MSTTSHGSPRNDTLGSRDGKVGASKGQSVDGTSWSTMVTVRVVEGTTWVLEGYGTFDSERIIQFDNETPKETIKPKG